MSRTGARVLCALLTLFAADGARAVPLIGVSGEAAVTPESLFELSTTGGSPTFVQTLGNGDGGEAIAFNPDDGLLYHASGNSEPTNDPDGRIFESVDLDSGTVTGITLSGPLADSVLALTYWQAQGVFLGASNANGLYQISPTGATSFVGALSRRTKGLAFAGGTLYGTGTDNNPILYTIDPTTAAITSSVNLTLSGLSSVTVPTGNAAVPFLNLPVLNVVGSNGLATDPTTGTLWGLVRVGLDTNTQGVNVDMNVFLPAAQMLNRQLATIDPGTGIATWVSTTPDRFAGLAFVPEPSTALLFGVGLLGLLGVARRARPR